jgi:hypothetical protein
MVQSPERDPLLSRTDTSNLMLRSVRPSSRRESRVQAPVLLTKDAIVGLGEPSDAEKE